MNTAYLITGANLGNREETLQQACENIEKHCGIIVEKSHIYETAAWGMENQPSFYNQLLKIETLLAPEDLMNELLKIEKDMGRIRTIKLGPRVIDIDILFYNDLVISNDIVTIPHPHLQKRRFVLVPLNEIASDVIHPVLKKSMRKLLDECEDNLQVNCKK